MSAVASQAALAGWLRQASVLPGAIGAMAIRGVDASRLAIHRNTFIATLVAALAEAFPVTRAIAGAGFFDSMARQRVLADPPRSPRVADYADDFPRFVADYPPAACLPFLASVARLEVLCLQAYHAADATPLPRDAFLALWHDPAQLRGTGVRLHPSAHWLRSRHAIHALWSAHQAVADMETADLGGIDLRQGQDVLVARPALDVAVVALPPGACDFLDALADGASLEAAVQHAGMQSPATEPSALFSLLLRYGLAVDLHDTRKDTL